MGCSCSKWRAPCSGCAAKLIPCLLGGVGCEGNGVAAVDEEGWMRHSGRSKHLAAAMQTSQSGHSPHLSATEGWVVHSKGGKWWVYWRAEVLLRVEFC
jgi:hypothetical protein